MIGESDLDGAVIEQLGMAVTGDLVHFVESGPREEDHGRAVAEIQGRLHGAEGDFAMVGGTDGDYGGTNEVEIGMIPQISLDDAPSANQLAIRRGIHVAPVSSLGSRTRL